MEKTNILPENYEFKLKIEYLKLKEKFTNALGVRDPIEYI